MSFELLSPLGSFKVDPPRPEFINDSSPLSFTLNVQAGFMLDSIDGCGGTFDLDTKTYTIQSITDACEMRLTLQRLEPVPVQVPTLNQYVLALLGLLMLAVTAGRLRNHRA